MNSCTVRHLHCSFRCMSQIIIAIQVACVTHQLVQVSRSDQVERYCFDERLLSDHMDPLLQTWSGTRWAYCELGRMDWWDSFLIFLVFRVMSGWAYIDFQLFCRSNRATYYSIPTGAPCFVGKGRCGFRFWWHRDPPPSWSSDDWSGHRKVESIKDWFVVSVNLVAPSTSATEVIRIVYIMVSSKQDGRRTRFPSLLVSSTHLLCTLLEQSLRR